MKTFRQYLHEKTFADLRPKTGEWTPIPLPDLKRAQHDPPVNIDTELYDLIAKSYSYIGGHVDFKKASDIPANHTIWYGLDVDGDKVPDVVKFGKDTAYGTKWTGGASDGSTVGKARYIEAHVKALNTPGNFCEVSDALMHILVTRYHIPYVEDHADVERIIGKKVRWIGAHPTGKYPGYTGFYERELGGAAHVKLLVGRPKGI